MCSACGNYLRCLLQLKIRMLSAVLFELIAFSFAIVGVFLTARGHVAGWILGIIGSALYIPVFFEGKLYAESALQLFYVLMGIYGWWHWLRTANGTNTLQVLSIGRITLLILSILLVIGSGFLGFCLDRFSNTDVPYFDATMGISGLLITWMMARKYIENWICWVIVDLANAGLFIYKSLYLTAFLYIIMAVIALYGLKTWRKELAKP